MVNKQWVEGFNQQIFGNDSTQSISRENLLAGFRSRCHRQGTVAMDMMKAQEYMRYSDWMPTKNPQPEKLY